MLGSTLRVFESFGPSSARKVAKRSEGEGEEAKEKGKETKRSLKGTWRRSGGGEAGGEFARPQGRVPLLATSSLGSFAVGRPRNLLFPMSVFASIF